MSLLTNIEAYWKMDESSGNPADATGNGHTFTNNGTIAFNAGLINNGSDAGNDPNTTKYFNQANGTSITTGAMSVSLWYNQNSELGGNLSIYSIFDLASGAAVYYQLQYYDAGGGKIIYFARSRYGIADDACSYTHTIGTGAWHHIVGTYDGADVNLYFDGSLVAGPVASTGVGITTPGSAIDLYMKVQYGVGVFMSPNKIDEVGLWSRGLTAAEVTTLYNGGVGLQYPFTTSSLGTFNGLAAASIGTINGLAFGSIS